ncbi:MAG: bifunctional glutamate N-acetyltransferase/amino-acid acetyltransferase ArgJ [Clostridia bacterium]|nr:bifunctional glutamate N-acetyltransferase/amino-acid acetyltransferase ArgJ [Clostridia bacterium]
MKQVPGGLCAATGFRAGGLRAGIKPTSPADKNDLGLLVSDVPCTAAGVFTTNRVKAAPVLLDMEQLKDGTAQAIIANSSIANACAPEGNETCRKELALVSEALGIGEDKVLVSSTGVIGVRLNVEAIEASLPALVETLTPTAEGSDQMARAIMTTDTVKKEISYEFSLGGKTAHIGGISKGSGMIHPQMGTMLCYLTTDAAVAPEVLEVALRDVVGKTFNRISVDGDMSTNDTCIILANGLAGNEPIAGLCEEYYELRDAMMEVCLYLCRLMAKDGEGASHLMTCQISGAKDEATAEVLGRSVINSSLTKAAIFGADANWGRVLCAMGYSGGEFDPEQVTISFRSETGSVLVCENGRGVDFSEEKAKEVLSEEEVIIDIRLKDGDGEATLWGCDLTYDYVKINGDYRT